MLIKSQSRHIRPRILLLRPIIKYLGNFDLKYFVHLESEKYCIHGQFEGNPIESELICHSHSRTTVSFFTRRPPDPIIQKTYSSGWAPGPLWLTIDYATFLVSRAVSWPRRCCSWWIQQAVFSMSLLLQTGFRKVTHVPKCSLPVFSRILITVNRVLEISTRAHLKFRPNFGGGQC